MASSIGAAFLLLSKRNRARINSISEQQSMKQKSELKHKQMVEIVRKVFYDIRRERYYPNSTAAEIQNEIDSPLHRLPAELLLHIAGSLDDVSIAPLRRTARKPFHTLDVAVKFFNEDQRKRLVRLVQRDKFLVYCQLERDGGLKGNSRMCSPCQKKHPQEAFSDYQLRKEPEVRICKAEEYVVRLCEHTSFTKEGIVAAACTWLRCSHPQHKGRTHVGNRLCPRQPTSECQPGCQIDAELYCSSKFPAAIWFFHLNYNLIYRMVKRIYCIDSCHRIGAITRHAVVSSKGMRDFFLGLSGWLCPHMQMYDLCKFQDSFFIFKHKHWGGLIGSRKQCPNRNCETTFALCRYKSMHIDGKDDILLCFSRELGNLKEPQDRNWLAQLVPPSSKHGYDYVELLGL